MLNNKIQAKYFLIIFNKRGNKQNTVLGGSEF